MNRKSRKFLAAWMIICQIFICGFASGQRIIELPDITESLKQISKDAKDTIAKYKNDLSPAMQKRVAVLRKMDSTAIVCLAPERVVKIFDRMFPLLVKLKPPTIKGIKEKYLKPWLNYQISGLLINRSQIDRYDLHYQGFEKTLIILGDRYHHTDYEVSYEFQAKVEELKERNKGLNSKILYSYPVEGQANFCPEHNEGGIIIFNQVPTADNSSGRLAMKWTDSKGRILVSDAGYMRDGNLPFIIPKEQMIYGELYKLDLIKLSIPDEVEEFWNARINSSNDLYFYNINEFMLALCEISKPLATIYFRLSNKDDLYYRFKDIEFACNNSTNSVKIGPFPEPLDSIEIFGTNIIGPLLNFKCKNEPTQLYNLILKPSVSNYLCVPTNIPTPVDTYADLNVFELAGLINQNHVYRMYESAIYLRGSLKLGVNNSLNGYNFDFTASESSKLKIFGKLAPRVTEKSFKVGRIVTEPLYIEVVSNYQDLCKSQYSEVKNALKKRLIERANFFYNIELRDCKRSGRTPTKSLDDFIKKENENLPASVSTILNNDYIPAEINPEEASYHLSFSRPFTKHGYGNDNLTLKKPSKKQANKSKDKKEVKADNKGGNSNKNAKETKSTTPTKDLKKKSKK